MIINNPIKKIDGVAFSICPSAYTYLLQDVSASDSGRTEDGLMDKARITQKVKLELEFAPMSTSKVSTVLKAFNPEYIEVEYLDAMQGGFVTKTFYVGDRTAPMYSGALDIWNNIKFNIIER